MNIMKDLFIHLHIPKTGGTTLRDIIQRQYRSEKILMIPKLEESENILKEVSTSQINQLKLIQGHLKYGLHNHFHRRAKYFAIIRDPINRVLSTYYYVLSQKNNPQNLSTSNNQMTIYDFVQSGVNPFLINGQTQLISGKTGEIDNPIIESEELFSLAKENIENDFLFLGITEMFDETILILKNMLGWHMPYYSIANRTKKKPNYDAVNPTIISFIKEHNQLDIKLYNITKTSLLNRIAEENDIFQNRINKFKKINRLLNPLFSYSRAIRLIRKYF
tara:strand:+ start:4188 stop:5015 length:828 start_codon:yes stop_codon:yes gene_type:complete